MEALDYAIDAVSMGVYDRNGDEVTVQVSEVLYALRDAIQVYSLRLDSSDTYAQLKRE